VPDNDEVMGRAMGEPMARGGALLLGRRSYEDFAGYWPNQTDNPYTDALNEAQKYVVSTTLREPLPWRNSTVLDGDVAAAVCGLKERLGKDVIASYQARSR
jgi:dihydrofolate reductase